jgi:hypothetical protein
MGSDKDKKMLSKLNQLRELTNDHATKKLKRVNSLTKKISDDYSYNPKEINEINKELYGFAKNRIINVNDNES